MTSGRRTAGVRKRALAWSAGLALFAMLDVGCGSAPDPCVQGGSGSPRCRPSASAPPHEAQPACLSIGAWNDLHGQIAPDGPVVDTGRVPAGGVIALADQIAELRATQDTVVLLDAGDLFTGPLESTFAEGAPIIEAYNLIGVDAVAVGNHEFDFGPVGYGEVTAKSGMTDEAGPRGPRGALMDRMRSASFPFLSANLHVAGGASPSWPRFAPSARIRKGAFDIGVVGYTTQETPTTTLRPNVDGLDFSTDAARSVAIAIRALRTSGASPIVLLAHASMLGVLPQALDDPRSPRDKEGRGEIPALVAALGPDRPDVIVAGHRHAWMLGRVDGIPIVSSDQHGVGLARIRYCREAGVPKFKSIDRYAVLASSPPRTELGRKVGAAMGPWLASVKASADAVVATLARPCLAQGVEGSSSAEQLARTLRARSPEIAPAPSGVPMVAIMNTGAVRAPLASGPLSYRDLFAALPFETTLSVCGTTRAGLERALKNAIQDPSSAQHFPFALSGARATVARAADGVLSLQRLELEGETRASAADAPVWLAIPDFILDGGDGFLEGITCTPSVRSSQRLRDAWREMLAREQGGCDGSPKNVVIRGP